jgi:hypothetical protein
MQMAHEGAPRRPRSEKPLDESRSEGGHILWRERPGQPICSRLIAPADEAGCARAPPRQNTAIPWRVMAARDWGLLSETADGDWQRVLRSANFLPPRKRSLL